jgi:hypothetical protein
VLLPLPLLGADSALLCIDECKAHLNRYWAICCEPVVSGKNPAGKEHEGSARHKRQVALTRDGGALDRPSLSRISRHDDVLGSLWNRKTLLQCSTFSRGHLLLRHDRAGHKSTLIVKEECERVRKVCHAIAALYPSPLSPVREKRQLSWPGG